MSSNEPTLMFTPEQLAAGSLDETREESEATNGYVLAIDDKSEPQTYLLDDEMYTVGRTDSCDVQLSNQFVSRQHAYLKRVPVETEEFTYELVEGNSQGTASTNGVFVNGERVQSRSLCSGDVVHFGPEVKAYFFQVAPRIGRAATREGHTALLNEQTAQTQLAIHFDAMLERIADRVRDSLDEQQIMQAAVRELALALDVPCCNAGVFDFDQQISTV
ncbi:MAG: FHA domain-containing protein, partial [Cyanobacteria bacterium P01_E01_bin.48]